MRLWIELLKNAYYKEPDFSELETLPNIDVNIKCGNSLISRHALDADISQALTKSKWSIDSYRNAIMTYRNAKGKEQKREMERLIGVIKSDFETEVAASDKRLNQLKKLNGDLFNLTNQTMLFEKSKKELAVWNSKVKDLTAKIQKLEAELEQINTNKIYENAFEWRFEFPEVLNDEGDFVGFDAIIGNPPYIRQEALGPIKTLLQNQYQVFAGTADILVYFFERGLTLLHDHGQFCMITSNKFMKTNYGRNLRNYLRKFQLDRIIDFGELPVFEEAATFPAIFIIEKNEPVLSTKFSQIKKLHFVSLSDEIKSLEVTLPGSAFSLETWNLASGTTNSILEKMNQNSVSLGDYVKGQIYRGILTGFNEAIIIDEAKRNELIALNSRSAEIIYPFANGDDIRNYHIRDKKRYIILTKIGVPIEEYPAIFNHLKKFQDQLEKRWDKGNHWWELRACDYYDLFLRPKIVYPEIAKESRFAYDLNGDWHLNKTCFSIDSTDLSLLGLLNSKVVWYYLKSICSVLGDAEKGGRLMLQKIYIETIPVPKSAQNKQEEISKIVSEVLNMTSADPNSAISAMEQEIDQIVYELYGLTEEEIKSVEGKN